MKCYRAVRSDCQLCLECNGTELVMSSDRQTRQTRRNMVAKHAGKFNKSYPMKSKVAYERDSKAVQREVEQTLADTLVSRNQAVQSD